MLSVYHGAGGKGSRGGDEVVQKTPSGEGTDDKGGDEGIDAAMVAGAETTVGSEADADQAEGRCHEKTVWLIRFQDRDRGLYANPDPWEHVNVAFGIPISKLPIPLDERQ